MSNVTLNFMLPGFRTLLTINSINHQYAITMKQKNEKESTSEMPQEISEKPTRKGLHKYFHVSRLDWYLSVVIAIIFTIFGVIELFDIAKLRFIRMGNSFQFAMLFAIFGMVSRIYYKMFEEQYEKR